jgi:ligand-binding sensor domain-containing protein
MIRFSKLIVALAFLFPVSGIGQTIAFKNYSVDQGLPFAQVFTIHQDKNGFLWSGAYGGLSRFDGKSFKNFTPQNGLANYWVTSISSDTAGNLWIGTITGLSFFDGRNFKNFYREDGLPDNYINAVCVDKNGQVWVGTNKGLAYFTGSRFIEVPFNSYNPIIINALFPARGGSVWVATNSGAYQFSSTSKSLISSWRFKDGLCDSVVTSIEQTADGKVFLGTQNGLSLLENGKIICYAGAQGLPDNSISGLAYDFLGNLWIGTPQGLSLFSGKGFKHYRIDDSFNGNRILAIFRDRELNIWLGTYNGLYKYSGYQFVSYSTEAGLCSEFVFPVLRDKAGILWVGTDNGLNRMSNGKFDKITTADGLSGNSINDMALGPDGQLYIGTGKGLSVYDGKNFKNYFGKKAGLLSDSVTAVWVEPNGKAWLGGHNGVSLMENGKITTFPLGPPDANFDVWDIYADSKGRIWFGTYKGGVFMFDGKNFRDMKKELGLKTTSIFGTVEDNYGNIFLGGFEGVYVYNEKLIDKIDEGSGLSSNLVYTLGLSNNKKFLWVGTNQGINRLDLEKYNKEKKTDLLHFGKEEGFIFGESNSNGFWEDPDGSLWFGTVGGLIHYISPLQETKTPKSITHITGIKLFYADTLLPQKVELPHDQNNISFNFVGICFSNPNKVRYKFILEGFDPDWSPETGKNEASYANLPPGKYSFKVISSNHLGEWNTHPKTFSFTILTPWWKTVWFRIFLALFIVLAVVAGIRIRIKQVELREKNKTLLASLELKALRAQMNPHFIFNALNSIQSFIITSNEEGATTYLNKFARLIRSILNTSEKSRVSLEEELEALKLYIELEALRFEGRFDYEIKVAEALNLDFYEIPTLLLQPYVENAILHGLVPLQGKKGKLEIQIDLHGDLLICCIRDNGIGRKASLEMRRKYMKPGYRSFGMSITKDRLELLNLSHKARMSVTVTDLEDDFGEPQGTQVDIYIPID